MILFIIAATVQVAAILVFGEKSILPNLRLMVEYLYAEELAILGGRCN